MRPREALAVLRLEDGRRWIDAATDWQRTDALAVLEGERPFHYQTRARGGSKTTDSAASATSVLVAAEDRLRCYWLASDADQASLALDAIAGFVARTPGLAERVQLQARRVLIPDSGAQLEVLPADAPGAWGLTPHWVFCDELANWPDTQGAAIVGGGLVCCCEAQGRAHGCAHHRILARPLRLQGAFARAQLAAVALL